MFRFIIIGCLVLSPSAFGYFLDGNGHYGLRPTTQTNPAFSSDRGLYQATLQTFRLLGEAKASDKLSLKLEFGIFRDPRTAFLGDSAEPNECTNTDSSGKSENRSQNRECQGRHQDTGEPGYSDYTPLIKEVYVEYGFDYCLLRAGRRARNWGMGVFQNNGHKPFDTARSVYDGISCDVNLQKTQTLAFSVGIDRLAETGTDVDIGLPTDNKNYGPSKTSDDLDQIYFTIEYDDRKANAGKSFRRNIGIYFANVFGSENTGDPEQSAKTDIKFADLYTAFYLFNLTLRNEVIFRLGKSADPSWSRYGAVESNSDTGVHKNKLDAIAVAGDLTYSFGRSGVDVGPREFNQGTASWHDIFLEYAYAPGDRDGYFDQDARRSEALLDSSTNVGAMAFHRNYRPTLILFNDSPEMDEFRVDGIYDPGKIMNVSLLAGGYRYNSLRYGSFEFKFISAQLNKSIPHELKHQILQEEASASDPGKRPVGFSGKHIGYEVDLKYSRAIERSVDLGLAAAVGIPGAAMKTSPKESPSISYLLQGSVVFKF